MSEQLIFELPHRPALGADDFLVSESNAAAVRLVDDWPRWPSLGHVIVGPAGSGKTHLANVWRLKTGAVTLLPAEFAGPLPDLPAGRSALLLEDLDRAHWGEDDLFHLLNLCTEARASVLLTARLAPAQWSVTLPDLASRLRSLPAVGIGAPDDALLSAVLLKQFTDRQLDVPPNVIAYLTQRMERSMEAATLLVAEIDRASLASGRRITRQLAAAVLERLGLGNEPDLPFDGER